MSIYEKTISNLAQELVIDDRSELDPYTKGYYTNEYGENVILLNKNILTEAEKLCVLMEELGHHYTTYGDITNQKCIKNKKQELKARRWAYQKLVGITDLVQASKQGIRTRHELAGFLGVTEDFLSEALQYYKSKYGLFYEIDNYIVYFDPLGVMEKFF